MDNSFNHSLEKVSNCVYRLKANNTLQDAYVISSEKLLGLLTKDRTLVQLSNVARLPGLVGPVFVMPDAHEGYGFPIGGVAAFDAEDLDKGIVSPGGVGYDINCGVRLAVVDLKIEEVRQKIKELTNELYKNVPGGLGSKSAKLRLKESELDELAEKGIDYLIKAGFATSEDKKCIEEYGRMPNADPNYVSDEAKKRGKDQVGSIGSGNHFVEVQEIKEIYDESIASSFGLQQGKVCIMIHSGSRGYGHQVCSDYLKKFEKYLAKNSIKILDKELVYAHLSTEEANSYLKAMACAINYAFCNRQLLLYGVREAFSKVFGIDELDVKLVYDVCHNIAKFEDHTINKQKMKVCVHRKGATRAFTKHRKELPEKYYETGQPVIIPGSMGTASYVLVGTQTAMELTYGSTCHGAGRVMSRHKAKEEFSKRDISNELMAKGIYVRATEKDNIYEEAPGAYKDIDAVIDAVRCANICLPIARNVPVAVIKG
ncbi:MAG: RtcB family protein [Candidatus Micrarchaeota archaeon]|nr:RtcB family protein [Candidatus Micrarchaeota archaeon]